MKNYILILLISIGLGFGACTDFLNPDQEDIMLEEDNFETSYDVLASVLGIYQSFQEAVDIIFLANDLRSDLVNTTSNAPIEFREIEESLLDPTNEYLSPRHFYKVISMSNEVIANLDRLKENDANVTDEIKERYEGELVFLRTASYLYLIRFFDNVVYYEEPINDVASVQNLHPMTKGEIIDTLLLHADKYVHLDKLTAASLNEWGWERGRMSEWAGRQLCAELNLERGNYAEAIRYALMVMASSREQEFQIGNRYADAKWSSSIFVNSEIGAADQEHLLYIGFNKRFGQFNPMQRWCSNGTDGVYYIKPSDIGVSYWARENSGAGDEWRGEGYSYTEAGPGEYVINKYLLNMDPFSYDMHFFIFRAPSPWFVYAEALNKLGYPQAAYNAISRGVEYGESSPTGPRIGIRGRVSLQDWIEQNPWPSGSEITKLDSMVHVDNFLLEEHARELAYEGSRFQTLVRSAKWRKQAGVEGAENFLGEKVAQKFLSQPSKQATLIEKLKDENNWYIPFDITQLNFDDF